MKFDLIPAINVDDFEEVKKRIKIVEPFVNPPLAGQAGSSWILPTGLLRKTRLGIIRKIY